MHTIGSAASAAASRSMGISHSEAGFPSCRVMATRRASAGAEAASYAGTVAGASTAQAVRGR